MRRFLAFLVVTLHDAVGWRHVGLCFNTSLLGTAMGVYTREGSCMECSVSVNDNGNAVSRSKLGGVFISRELCQWIGSSRSYFHGLGAGSGFRSSSEGILIIQWKSFLLGSRCTLVHVDSFSFFQAIYLFGFGIPLFIDNREHPHRIKWDLWVVHRLVLTAVYGCILFMYNSRWRERLPGKFCWDEEYLCPESNLNILNFWHHHHHHHHCDCFRVQRGQHSTSMSLSCSSWMLLQYLLVGSQEMGRALACGNSLL